MAWTGLKARCTPQAKPPSWMCWKRQKTYLAGSGQGSCKYCSIVGLDVAVAAGLLPGEGRHPPLTSGVPVAAFRTRLCWQRPREHAWRSLIRFRAGIAGGVASGGCGQDGETGAITIYHGQRKMNGRSLVNLSKGQRDTRETA